MYPSRGVRLRSQAFAAGAVTSLVSFWVLVRAVAADAPAQVQNVLLVLAAIAVVLLVVALWVPPSRAAVLGGVAGMAAAVVAVLGLAAVFGGYASVPAAAASTNQVTEGPVMPRAGVCATEPS